MKPKRLSLSLPHEENGLLLRAKKSIPLACCFALVSLGVMSTFFDLPVPRYQPPPLKVQEIGPKCQSMFNVGVQRYPSRTGFGNRHFGDGVAPGTAYYEGLADTLPSVLRKLPNGSLDMQPKSRFDINLGHLKYLDCDVRMYNSEEFEECAELWERDKEPLWIAFVGDSQMRNKFKQFLKLTQNFNWFIYNVTSKSNMRYKQSSVVVGDKGARVDFIWATEGLETHIYSNPRTIPEPQLENWAYKESRVPNLVIVGFGLWTILDEFERRYESLKAITLLVDAWLKTAKTLHDLSTRTTVLAWCQARTKEFTAIDYSTVDVGNKSAGIKMYRTLHFSRLYAWAGEWIDEVMHMALRRTGVIIWDSMVPHNLLNIRECRALHQAGMSRHPFYNDRLHSCHDYLHTDNLTIRDEHTMVMNFLCNGYMDKEEEYCCS